MSERHAVHGTIVDTFERPPADTVTGLGRHDTAKVGDAMAGYGVVHHEIKPIAPEMRLIGTALTVLTKPGDALYVQKAIDLAQPGDVIVIDAAGLKDVAVIGERLADYYRRKGAVGIVVDGAVRDARGIIDVGLPTFARGTCIKIFGSLGPGAINVPIQWGGVPVHPGDILLGDRDGVVIVPRRDAERILKVSDEHLDGELARAKRVEAGETIESVFTLGPKLAKWS